MVVAVLAPIGITKAFAAQSAPPWEPDADAATPYANIVFYDANGNQIASGTNLANAFAWAVGTTGIDSGATKALLAFAQPEPPPSTPGTWSTSGASGTTSFSALTALNTPASVLAAVGTEPVVSVGSTGANINSFASSFPSSTTAGYVDIIEVRLTDSGPSGAGNPSGTYWDTDIGYNKTATAKTIDGTIIPANGWAQLFPFLTPTTTTLTSTLPSPQSFGTDIPLKATVSPAEDGTVQFFDGGTALGTPVAVGAGVADFTDSRPPATGGHSYTAVFVPTVGDETNVNTATATIVGQSKSSALSYTISAAATSTATVVVSNPDPSVFGQLVTYTATVNPTPDAGKVEFFDGVTAISGCSSVSLTGATAICSPAAAPTLGMHSITAQYLGDASFKSSTSVPITQTVNQASSSTVLTTSANPAGSGQTVTLTATVSPVTPGVGTPTGTVDFENNTTSITSPNDCSAVSLSSGVATCQTSFTVGSYSLSAVYFGDTNFTGSTGPLTQTVNPATTTTVTSSASSSVFGQSVTYTATVAPVPPGTGTPAGTVTFKDGTTTICPAVTLAAGQATCTPSTPPAVGTHGITGVYGGNASFGGSTSTTLSQVVNKAITTIVVATANPSVSGQPVTYTATISVTTPGAGKPTGMVDFKDVGVDITGCTVAAVNTTIETATCKTSPSSGSVHSIVANYSGDSNFKGATSSPVDQVVNAAATTTSLKSTTNPSLVNRSVTFTATVSVTPPGSGIPTGAIEFENGGTDINGCSARILSAGRATCTFTFTSSGPNTITAVYGGSPALVTSTSAVLTQNVVAATVTTPPTNLKASAGNKSVTLTWGPPSSNGGSPVTGYFVEYATNPAGNNPSQTATVTGRTVTVSGIKNGTKYYFVAFAVNAVGDSTFSNEVSAVPVAAPGYWVVEADGSVYHFGTAAALRSPVAGVHLAKPIVGMASTPSGGGYWLVAGDGGLFTAGNAGFHGSLGNVDLAAPIVGIVATPDGGGYWMVGSDGGVFTFGNAGFHGSLGNVDLAAPIVGIVATPDGGGYWLVAKDGGVFAFGDAGFNGSLGNVSLSSPIVAMAAAAHGGGYWLVAADGSVYHFGKAAALNSIAGAHLARPIAAIVATPDGGGFWLIGGDGGAFNEGDAVYHGSVPGLGLSVTDVVDGSAAGSS